MLDGRHRWWLTIVLAAPRDGRYRLPVALAAPGGGDEEWPSARRRASTAGKGGRPDANCPPSLWPPKSIPVADGRRAMATALWKPPVSTERRAAGTRRRQVLGWRRHEKERPMHGRRPLWDTVARPLHESAANYPAACDGGRRSDRGGRRPRSRRKAQHIPCTGGQARGTKRVQLALQPRTTADPTVNQMNWFFCERLGSAYQSDEPLRLDWGVLIRYESASRFLQF